MNEDKRGVDVGGKRDGGMGGDTNIRVLEAL